MKFVVALLVALFVHTKSASFEPPVEVPEVVEAPEAAQAYVEVDLKTTVGLRNGINICFANGPIQALFAHRGLVQTVLDMSVDRETLRVTNATNNPALLDAMVATNTGLQRAFAKMALSDGGRAVEGYPDFGMNLPEREFPHQKGYFNRGADANDFLMRLLNMGDRSINQLFHFNMATVMRADDHSNYYYETENAFSYTFRIRCKERIENTFGQRYPHNVTAACTSQSIRSNPDILLISNDRLTGSPAPWSSINFDETVTLPAIEEIRKPEAIYDLFAVVTHTSGFHYYAMVKYGDQWYRADDSTITPTTWEEVKKLSAVFVSLLYARRGTEREKPLRIPTALANYAREELAKPPTPLPIRERRARKGRRTRMSKHPISQVLDDFLANHEPSSLPVEQPIVVPYRLRKRRNRNAPPRDRTLLREQEELIIAESIRIENERKERELMERQLRESAEREEIEHLEKERQDDELFEKLLLEKEHLEKELQEKELRLKELEEEARKKKEHQDREEKEKKERLEKVRQEKQRLLKERQEKKRQEKEKMERLEKEEEEGLDREQKERLEKEEKERLEKEKKERLEKEEKERLEKERFELERKERLDKEEKERQEKEQKERLAREEQERLDKEENARLAKEELERLQEKIAREQKEIEKRLEQERREAIEKAEREKLAREQKEKADKENKENDGGKKVNKDSTEKKDVGKDAKDMKNQQASNTGSNSSGSSPSNSSSGSSSSGSSSSGSSGSGTSSSGSGSPSSGTDTPTPPPTDSNDGQTSTSEIPCIGLLIPIYIVLFLL